MKKLFTTISILLIATASYAQTYTVERAISSDECGELGGEIVNTLDGHSCPEDHILGKVVGMRCPCICCKNSQDVKSNLYTVERVIDGNTLKLTNGERVRLIGIDTPDFITVDADVAARMDVTVEQRDELERWDSDIVSLSKMGLKATEFVKGLGLEGKEVRLEFDVQERDKYGRMLAYVWRIKKYDMDYLSVVRWKADPLRKSWKSDKDFGWYLYLVNGEIIKAGYATPMTIPPNVKYAELFKELYEQAREAKRGLWDIKKEGMICDADDDCDEIDCTEHALEPSGQGLDKGECVFSGNRICWQGKCFCQDICT